MGDVGLIEARQLKNAWLKHYYLIRLLFLLNCSSIFELRSQQQGLKPDAVVASFVAYLTFIFLDHALQNGLMQRR